MKSLESEYSRIFTAFMEGIIRQYKKILIEAATEIQSQKIEIPDDTRINALSMSDIVKRFKAMRELISSGKIYDKVLSTMDRIFYKIDGQVTRGIIGSYLQAEYPVPNMQLKVELQALRDCINLNVKLITSITEKSVDNFEAIIRSVVSGNIGIIEARKQMQEEAGYSKRYAQFVAMDQVAKTYADINQERQQSLGFPGYIWEYTHDSKVDPEHKELGGHYYTWDKPPSYIKDGKTYIGHPGKIRPNCRCIARPAFAPE